MGVGADGGTGVVCVVVGLVFETVLVRSLPILKNSIAATTAIAAKPSGQTYPGIPERVSRFVVLKSSLLS